MGERVISSTLYFLGGISWLAVTGIGALNLRTYLLSEGSIKFDSIYYTFLTLHGDAGMIAFVEFSTIAILLYLLKGLSGRILNLTFLVSNLGLVLFFLGAPLTGWYLTYPLSTQSISFMGVYGNTYWVSYVGLLLECISMEITSVYVLRRSHGFLRIPSALMVFSIPFLGTVSVVNTLGSLGYSFPPLVVNLLFWEYGSPATYFLTLAVFAFLYSKTEAYSVRWTKWSMIPFLVLPFLASADHLQTWPLPVWVRELSDYSSVLLSGLMAINFLNLVIPMKKTDPLLEMVILGFALATFPSLILPFLGVDQVVHNTYYVVGSFHSIIWDFLVLGFLASFAYYVKDELKEKEERLVLLGGVTWLTSSTLLSYLMMYLGYEGLLRREVIFPAKFLPYELSMSLLALTAVGGLSLSFSVPLYEMAKRLHLGQDRVNLLAKEIRRVAQRLSS